MPLLSVLVHLDDGMTEADAPWEPCHRTEWCAAGADHVSFSLINAETPYLYGKSNRGFGLILSPHVVGRPGGVMCSYSSDGGTWGAGMGCHGDPPSADGACRPDSPPELCYCTLRRYWGCVFPPHALEEMMTVQVRRSHGYYNEVVINSTFWARHLPGILEAFVDFGNGRRQAQTAHTAFHQRFRRALDEREVPLLSWTPQDGFIQLP